MDTQTSTKERRQCDRVRKGSQSVTLYYLLTNLCRGVLYDNDPDCGMVYLGQRVYELQFVDHLYFIGLPVHNRPVATQKSHDKVSGKIPETSLLGS